MNKELLRDAIAVMETGWARSPQDMSASDRAVVDLIQAEIDAPEQKPERTMCRVKGSLGSGVMCGSVIVGSKACSDIATPCQHHLHLYTKPQLADDDAFKPGIGMALKMLEPRVPKRMTERQIRDMEDEAVSMASRLNDEGSVPFYLVRLVEMRLGLWPEGLGQGSSVVEPRSSESVAGSSPAPDLTDAEIVEIAIASRGAEPGRDGYILPIAFARAVLAAQKVKS